MGTSIGPYQVLERLGAGGMGEVFLCHDSRLHRKVALKCLTASESDDAQAALLREARAAARLTHPHIAGIYDVLEYDGRAFIVMEYVEGESLRARLLRGALSPDEAIAIGRQLAEALAAAHDQGVIHRDLKPSNVQLMPDGTVKVLDFGVAKMMPRLDESSDVPTTTRAVSRERLDSPGTPVYMAPEQLVGGHLDVRSDIYSLGVLLFEMTTGRRPYLETNAVALAVAMTASPPPPPDAIDPRVPRRLSSVIVKALQREPFNRYQSARELAAALNELTEPTTREVVHAAAPERPRGAGWAAAILVATAAIVIAALASVFAPGLFRRGAGGLAPRTIAILPVDNPTDDARAGQLGALLETVVATNLRSTDRLRTVSREATAPFAHNRRDVGALGRELGAEYVLDLVVTNVTPAPRIVVRLTTTDPPGVVWDEALTGDGVRLIDQTLDGIVRVLAGGGARKGLAFRADELAHLRAVPTRNPGALMAYVDAQALLDRSDVPDNLTAAIDKLQQAIDAAPSFALAHAALCTALVARYQSDRSQTMLDRANTEAAAALRLDAQLGAAHYASGLLQNASGRREGAIASLHRAIAIDPADASSYRLLGQLIADAGRVDEGVAEINRAIRLRPDYWNNYYTLGFVLYNAGRYQEAMQAYRRVTELLPAHAGAFAMLGTIAYQLGLVEEAIGHYEHSVRLGPSAAAYANLAFAYYAAKRYTEALAAYEHALGVNPKSALNHRNIGDVYVRLGRRAQARAAYERAITVGEEQVKTNPRDAGTISLIAVCEAKLGRAALAERHAAEGVTLAPTNRQTLQRSAEVHALLGQSDKAIKDLQAAIERGYGRRQARDNDEFASLRGMPAFQALVADRPSAGVKE